MTYLKKLRLESGYTQEEIAEKIGVSISVYRKYEQRQRNTSGMALNTALALKHLLNLDLELLNQQE